jgi:hypothetical protein
VCGCRGQKPFPLSKKGTYTLYAFLTQPNRWTWYLGREKVYDIFEVVITMNEFIYNIVLLEQMKTHNHKMEIVGGVFFF